VACQSRAAELLGRGAPLLDFAEERALPLLFHVTTLPGEAYSQAADVFKIIESRPRLRFCLAHALLFHREYLARADAAPNVWVDTAAMKIQVECVRPEIGAALPASEFLDADYSDYRDVMRVLCERFPDTVIWGTDSPAYSWICRRKQAEGVWKEFRLKAAYADEVAALACLKPELRGRVGGANALDFIFGPA
jgi:predicted TIM-barrel fold metal-dependent hydrolase